MKKLLTIVMSVILGLSLAILPACIVQPAGAQSGTQGPVGPQGPAGPRGPQGPAGPLALKALPVCKACPDLTVLLDQEGSSVRLD